MGVLSHVQVKHRTAALLKHSKDRDAEFSIFYYLFFKFFYQ